MPIAHCSFTVISSVGCPVSDDLEHAYHDLTRASLVAQLVKNLPAMRETRVQSLGWGDPLEKGKATHSSILTWRILWTEQLSLL